MTKYLVLRGNTDAVDRTEGAWGVPSEVEARSAASAIRQIAERDGEGYYVAIPKRSWKPVSVKVETKTALRFS